jgi:hypothetical protein
MREIELTGLDGSNLLAYLAALGTLRVLTLAETDRCIRMRWVELGFWTPVVQGTSADTPDELAEMLGRRVCPRVAVMERKKGKTALIPGADLEAALANANPAFLEDYLDLSLDEFSSLLKRECSHQSTRESAAFLAGLGSDCLAEKNGDGPATTALRAIGAGNNDGFLGLMRTIHRGTDAGHLRHALFQVWDYSDPPPFMRWDSNEFRPHALRATDPAKDRERNNVRGANRLAIEALPLFPTVPQARRVRTTAFQEGDNGTEVWWPIWTDALELGTVASLLAAGDERVRPGVAQVYRAARFTEGKYRNFSPSKAML